KLRIAKVKQTTTNGIDSTSIDSWVVRKAIALIATHSRAGQKLVLHVNLSAKSICDPKFVGIVEEALLEEGIDPACLVLEITETAARANLEQAKIFADRLSRRGCLIALDDFGAGFASFYYLKNFTFDYLKIDGEFIRNLSANPVNRLVVEAIVGIARGMGKKTVAEFVSDEETIRLLRESGVDYAQGYHIGAPSDSHRNRMTPALSSADPDFYRIACNLRIPPKMLSRIL
ncbi:MAG: EAL domain-containing protein, partial [Desulfomicrobium escambiense]|nr:EAL domain-containing protein [Desulfomicrobium escambiense]